MRIIVGLGNPGREYQGTRHNIGFEVLYQLASRWNVGKLRQKFKAEVGEAEVAGQKVVLIAPMTFMNLSGQSVRAAVDFYKIQNEELMLVCDDLSLEPGRIRIRAGGSAGGQKGLANTIQQLGSDLFPRLRVGIGRPPGQRSAADYVLDLVPKAERSVLDVAIMRAADAVETWVRSGVEMAMNQFNSDPLAKEKTETKRPRSPDAEPGSQETHPPENN